MIRFEQVVKQFGTKKVLDGLSFEIGKGETFAIVGPSGTGKSVTLKHMVGLLRPTDGRVWVDGQEVSGLKGKAMAQVRERFGYLFQGAALLGWMNVADNVALPLRERTRLAEDEIEKRVTEALQAVGLAHDHYKFPSEISGGMQKRVGLARAIVRAPEIVLYDEPTSGLDPVTALNINRLIRGLNRDLGITSVVVTHDMQGALMFADRIAMLKDGKFLAMATPQEFMELEQPDVQEFLRAQLIDKAAMLRLRAEIQSAAVKGG